jgi:2-methylisocitrate lyase-like PEP mutase family enzyme
MVLHRIGFRAINSSGAGLASRYGIRDLAGRGFLLRNMAFSPKTIRKVFVPVARRISLAVTGKAGRAGAGD